MHGNRAAHHLQQAVGRGEPQPGPLPAIPGPSGADEALEEVPEGLPGHPHPRVTDHQVGRVVLGPDVEEDEDAALVGVLNRILQQLVGYLR